MFGHFPTLQCLCSLSRQYSKRIVKFRRAGLLEGHFRWAGEILLRGKVITADW